jgi:RNase P subunit RPR2
MTLQRGRGRITTRDGQAFVVARCPLCGQEHRYNKGDSQGEEIQEIRKLGFTEEWMPCQHDLPGNFWRIAIVEGTSGDRTRKSRRRRGARAA